MALLVTTLGDAGEVLAGLAIVGGLTIAIISVVSNAMIRSSREKRLSVVQREIAAYVAEGTMTVDDGERLMRASNEPKKDE